MVIKLFQMRAMGKKALQTLDFTHSSRKAWRHLCNLGSAKPFQSRQSNITTGDTIVQILLNAKAQTVITTGEWRESFIISWLLGNSRSVKAIDYRKCKQPINTCETWQVFRLRCYLPRFWKLPSTASDQTAKVWQHVKAFASLKLEKAAVELKS